MSIYTRRRTIDRIAARAITGGGAVIIVSILAILAFLIGETLPLWRSASLDSTDPALPHESDAWVLATANEYREVLFALDADGAAATWVRDGDTWSGRRLPRPDGLGSATITSARPVAPDAGEWLVGTADGRIARLRFDSGLTYDGAQRRYRPRVGVSDTVSMSPGVAVARIAAVASDEGITVATLGEDGRVRVLIREVERNLFGAETVSDSFWDVPVGRGITASAIELDAAARHLYVGSTSGQLVEWPVDTDAHTPLGSYRTGSDAVTALGTVLGRNSLVVGNAGGEVQVWFRARTVESGLRLIRAHEFEPHGAPVVGTAPSGRNRGFVTWDASGELCLRFATTSATRLTRDLNQAPASVVFAPKSDALIAAFEGNVATWALDDAHPEVSFASLFRPVHYEGYEHADYTWQSTGGTDEAEPKLSLVPLIFGTFKGTLYAMLFSVPIAILAALYTATFMDKRLRGVVKPAMELMATLPSVVLGLLAGLWLAPRLAQAMPAALGVGVFIALAVLLAGALRRVVPRGLLLVRPGTEVLGLVPVVLVAIGLTVGLSHVADRLFPGGFLEWLYTAYEIRYDQRNAIVVGIAMGLAVIPIIFSVSEDSLSSVPRHLTAGSLALGATPWQTAWLVILPAASPGIFSAIMIGFGRAVGETMIMLMATGNTPVMDWSLFNGFRTLSANIATEIPEAPHGDSLYRILFLSALLLFALTLVINTTAEVVRTRLRRRYSRF